MRNPLINICFRSNRITCLFIASTVVDRERVGVNMVIGKFVLVLYRGTWLSVRRITSSMLQCLSLVYRCSGNASYVTSSSVRGHSLIDASALARKRFCSASPCYF